jgi:hypothetical protein
VTLFFIAFLPQFVQREAGHEALQMLVLALVFIAQAFVIFSAIALFSGAVGAVFRRRARFRPSESPGRLCLHRPGHPDGLTRTTASHFAPTLHDESMALLQISEPGMSTAPHQRRLAVGIDLGTTNSLVATVRNSIPEVLADDDGRVLLPSVVRYLPNGHANIGYKAQAAGHRSGNTIVSVKRFMGRGLKDIAHAENMPYDSRTSPAWCRSRPWPA